MGEERATMRRSEESLCVEEGEWEGRIPMSDQDIGQPGLGQAETVGHPHFQVGQTLLAKRCDCRELGARLERGKTRLRLVQKKRGACILILGAKKNPGTDSTIHSSGGGRTIFHGI